ncbi:hypothetical protein DV736_g649, partial [Chaetothyriales sp. CBS 134916]
MTFRRGERRFDTPDDISSGSDEEANQVNCLMVKKPRPRAPEEEPPIHLALTDFGPQSLVRFMRAQLEKAKENAKPDEENARDDSSPGRTRSKPNRCGHRAADDSRRMSSKPSVSVADNAPHNLRGLDGGLSRCLAKANQSAPMQSELGRPLISQHRTVISHHASAPRESAPGPTSPSSLAIINRRSMDFVDHAESVRSRIRAQSKQASHRDSARRDQAEGADETAPRPRKTSRRLSHLITMPSTRALVVESPSSCLGETRDDPGAMYSARSPLSITDGENDNPVSNSPGPLNPAQPDRHEPDLDLAMVDFSEEAQSSSEQDEVDADLPRRPEHVNNSSSTRSILRSRPKGSKGPSSIDHARHVPTVVPQFVTSKRESHTTSKPKTAPTTPEGLDDTSLGATATSGSSQGSALSAVDRRRKSANGSKAKSKTRLDMIFDPSSSAWSPRHPGLDPFTCGHRLPGFKHGGKYTTLSAFNYDIWLNISEYLSAADLKRLRLVNHAIADKIAPLLVRSVVTKFGKRMFHLGDWDGESTVPHSQSVFAKYGKYIQKFGISFDYDLIGLAYPTPKVFSELVHAWFGDYEWPVATYPRFPQLQELEDLVDCNRPLLKEAFANLTGVSELALSLDSGHGWLEGADICDLALFEANRTNGSKVFGETFSEDVWNTYGRNEYFKWAQQNSINETLQRMAPKTGTWRIRQRIKELSRMLIREYDSFREQHSQYDFNLNSHTGGQAMQGQTVQRPVQNPTYNPGLPFPHIPDLLQAIHPPVPPQRSCRRDPSSTSRYCRPPQSVPIPLQWPLIFNCYNIAADVGGRELIAKSADPATFPLIPGHLTELQVQWVMETLWAQRAFLSSYTTAIIAHKFAFRNIHTLTIAKISSGILPSLAQHELWTSLTSLRRLKILVKPDWRDEHVYGDKFYALNMPINPSLAAGKLTEFLHQNITDLENLSHLTIGYFGGGEHATGMFARNTHVLPAPITQVPQSWVSNHNIQPDPSTLLIFPHIRDLTFENCWFSPCMLESFMETSRDTSLHTLVLDSVSMLSKHCTTSIEGPLSTLRNNLKCNFMLEDWLRETLPVSAVWTEVLDNITPGDTMEDRKVRAGMIKRQSDPPFEKEFRGNITRIVLRSCGYCRISGVNGDQLNQNDLVVHPLSGNGPPHQFDGVEIHHGGGTLCDIGLHARRARFDKVDLSFLDSNNQLDAGVNQPDVYHADDPVAGNNADGFTEEEVRALAHARHQTVPFLRRGTASRQRAAVMTATTSDTNPSTREGSLMMSTSSPDGAEYFGLGTLTQCIHPIEKRVLEKAWGMRFGWGDDMRRWESVSDGWLEGGTGRFSGIISVVDGPVGEDEE